MTLYRPAILLHGALAAAAFIITLASSARGDHVPPPEPPAQRPPAAVYGSDALAHAEAVYRTMRYAQAEDALRCAGFANVGPTRGLPLLVAGKDYEVVPHPAVRHAAEVDLQSHGSSGAGLCAYLQQPAVRNWYRERFAL
ncbi:hypothetical protein ACFPOE_00130 [Caenimonas terrae]|uniref:Uncharacterized protein n=1 Tax=Caenimonas terrae TaxID=696074 RepID=A0ABW0N7K8_9BURK